MFKSLIQSFSTQVRQSLTKRLFNAWKKFLMKVREKSAKEDLEENPTKADCSKTVRTRWVNLQSPKPPTERYREYRGRLHRRERQGRQRHPDERRGEPGRVEIRYNGSKTSWSIREGSGRRGTRVQRHCLWRYQPSPRYSSGRFQRVQGSHRFMCSPPPKWTSRRRRGSWRPTPSTPSWRSKGKNPALTDLKKD